MKGKNKGRRKVKKQTLLVAWFKENQWDHLTKIVSDPENLGKNYNDWRKQAEHNISQFRKTGGFVKKIAVDTEQMLEWANENGLKLNTSYLSHYAMHVYEERSPTVVVCWYKKEQWDHLKEIISDPENMHDSYDEWEKSSEDTITQLRSQGQRIKKIPVDTEQMLAWANDNKMTLKSSNLSYYAIHLFSKEHKAKPLKHARKNYGNNFYGV